MMSATLAGDGLSRGAADFRSHGASAAGAGAGVLGPRRKAASDTGDAAVARGARFGAGGGVSAAASSERRSAGAARRGAPRRPRRLGARESPPAAASAAAAAAARASTRDRLGAGGGRSGAT